jgi:hypothetical protein
LFCKILIQFYSLIILDLDWSFPSHFGAHIEVLSVVTVVIVKLKIQFFKRIQWSNLKMSSRSIFRKNFTLEAINRSSLANFTTILVCLLLFCFSIFVGIKLNRLHPTQLNQYPNYLFMYFFQFIIPSIFGLSIPALFYIRNPVMRHSVLSEFKNYFYVNV